jgi:hypothetical protein
MTDTELRDWFAGMYMTDAIKRPLREYELEKLFPGRGGVTLEEIGAVLAYRYADAMLERRKR